MSLEGGLSRKSKSIPGPEDPDTRGVMFPTDAPSAFAEPGEPFEVSLRRNAEYWTEQRDPILRGIALDALRILEEERNSE